MSRGMSYGPNWFPVAVQALVILAGSDHACSSNSMAQAGAAHARSEPGHGRGRIILRPQE
ncbi:MAG: hypothetical protein PVSMB4_11610 [Ktedonobacterales bacterium]